ncbi:MAG: hypothetical protein U1G07_17575 [Verrucomicrobiota bacterium]
MNPVDVQVLFASLIWGAIGLGYCVYGKRQQSIEAMTGGILIITTSYLAGSALSMSLLSFVIVIAVYLFARRS